MEAAEFAYIYIPKESTAPFVEIGGTKIVKGSAIIGLPNTSSVVWFEGNLYDAVNLRRFNERVRNAADRAFNGSFSAFTGGMNKDNFYRVGIISRDYAIFLDDVHRDEKVIENWTAETPAAIYKENKHFLMTRAFNDKSQRNKMFHQMNACLTCNGKDVKNLQKELTSTRVFCNASCQLEYYFNKLQLRIRNGDESGPAIDDAEIIGIENTTTGRKFRITRDQAMQFQTIADLFRYNNSNAAEYIPVTLDNDYGLAFLIDWLRDPNIVINTRRFPDLLKQAADAAGYMGAESFIWDKLYDALRIYFDSELERYSSFIYRELKDGNSDLWFREFFTKFKNFMPRFVYTLPYISRQEFKFLLKKPENREIYNEEVYKRLNFWNDGDKFWFMDDNQKEIVRTDDQNTDLPGWELFSIAMYDNAFCMGKIMRRSYLNTLDNIPKNLKIWSTVFTTAAKAGNVDVLTYLMQDKQVANLIDIKAAFVAAVSSSQAQVVDILLSDQRIGVDEKYKAMSAGMSSMSLDIAKKLLSDKRVDPSVMVSGNSLFTIAVKRNQAEIVRLMLSDVRVDPSLDNNLALKNAAQNLFSDTVIVLLQDERVDPNVIPELYKTPEIVQALRARFQKGEESDQKRSKK